MRVSCAQYTQYTSILIAMIDHSLLSLTTCGKQSLDEEGSSDHGHGGRGHGGHVHGRVCAQGSSEPLAAVNEDQHAVDASPLPVPAPCTDETAQSARFDNPQSSSVDPGCSLIFDSPIFGVSDHPIPINDPQSDPEWFDLDGAATPNTPRCHHPTVVHRTPQTPQTPQTPAQPNYVRTP